VEKCGYDVYSKYSAVDGEIIVFIERELKDKFTSVETLSGQPWEALVGIKQYDLHGYPIMRNSHLADAGDTRSIYSNSLFASRYELIIRINKYFHECLDKISFSKSEELYSIWNLISRCRSYLLAVSKKDTFQKALDRSQGGSNEKSLNLCRSQANIHIAEGRCDEDGRWSIFGQGF